MQMGAQLCPHLHTSVVTAYPTVFSLTDTASNHADFGLFFGEEDDAVLGDEHVLFEAYVPS